MYCVYSDIIASGSDVVALIGGRRIEYRLGAAGEHWVLNSIGALAVVVAGSTSLAVRGAGRLVSGTGTAAGSAGDADWARELDETASAKAMAALVSRENRAVRIDRSSLVPSRKSPIRLNGRTKPNCW